MDAPLVSCVMATRGRAPWVAQSIRYFLEQDYPSLELVIVHDEDADLPAPLPGGARVRTLRVGPGRSLGEKRNLGAEEARGAIVAQWDDDDWYGPGRIRAQAAPLLDGSADVSALRGALFFEPRPFRFWRAAPALHARMFVEDVHGGTLVYRREVWERLARYPLTNLREDADFLVAAMAAGARLSRLPADDAYVYVRHDLNTWRFSAGSFLDPAGWARAAEPASFGPARAFYQERLPAPAPAGPRVSCIMPTCDRRAFVPRAVRHFLQQTYAASELVVIDDGAVGVGDLLPRSDRIRHVRLPGRASIGHKRNLACGMAAGEIVLHWDDDDWMAPSWIAAQVGALRREGADVVGLSAPYFYDPVRRAAWRYRYPRGGRPWVHGGTLCYTRDLWRGNRFPDVSLGEDVRFLWSPVPKKVVAHDRADAYVAWIHAGNASPKPGSGARWRRCPVELVERLLVTARPGGPS